MAYEKMHRPAQSSGLQIRKARRAAGALAGWLCLLVLAVTSSGCAFDRSKPKPTQAAAAQVAAAAGEPRPQWWYARLRFAFAEDGGPNSYLDTLVADQLFAPLIRQYRDDIELWRFHRRWAADETGHQFSFLVFAVPDAARPMLAGLAGAPLLQSLRAQGHLIDFRIHPAPADRVNDPAATSDPGWPAEIQREWPHYIMGASRMWLGLIEAEAAKHVDLELHERYRAVSDALDSLWFENGNHAFLHHLSALFGYSPVRVIYRDVMTF